MAVMIIFVLFLFKNNSYITEYNNSIIQNSRVLSSAGDDGDGINGKSNIDTENAIYYQIGPQKIVLEGKGS